MIITNDLFEIDDQIEKMVAAILVSDSAKLYQNTRYQLESSEAAQEQKHLFMRAKEEFEQMEQYGSYAPDFKEKQRAVRKAKRVLDLTEEVAEFRIGETNMQNILDTISLTLSQAISKEIKVETGNPFFEKGRNSGCGGNCHAS